MMNTMNRIFALGNLLVGTLLGSCSDSNFVVYASSKDKLDYIFDRRTGEFWPDSKSPLWARKPRKTNDLEDSPTHRLIAYKKERFYYVVPLNVIVPLNWYDEEWEDGDLNCVKYNNKEKDYISIKCHKGRSYLTSFTYGFEKGLIRFEADCIDTMLGRCLFELEGDSGLFARLEVPKDIVE